jgi:hypothetical protein
MSALEEPAWGITATRYAGSCTKSKGACGAVGCAEAHPYNGGAAEGDGGGTAERAELKLKDGE